MAIAILKMQTRLPALFSTPYVARTGSTIAVGAGGDFQAALNSASPGDKITLNAGSTYSGHFSLPAKSGSDYVYIQSSASLTPEGTRVTTGDLSGFPKIVTPDASAAIQAAVGSSYYRFINCDIKSGSTPINGYLIGMGTGDETNAANFPHHLVIDRCGVRGHSTNGGRRGVMFSGSYQAVIDSYLSDWKEVGADTQAIAGWTGAGPYKIVNNYLEGAGENVMFGGAGTNGYVVTPSDIEIRGNLIFKPLTWMVGHPSYAGTHWSIKNSLELKHAKRVLIQDNIVENCWADSQVGFAVLFTVRNQMGSTPWATVEDVTYRYNTMRHCANGVNMLGWDNDTGIPSQYAKRVSIYRNLFYDIGLVPANGDGILFQILQPYDDIAIDHNTANHTGSTLVAAYGAGSARFKLTNNIALHNLYGIQSDQGSGNATLAHYFPGYDMRKNVLVMNTGDYSGQYPTNNFYPPDMASVGFVNLTNNADLRLAPSSPYKNAATDGTDVGADMATPA